MTTLQMTAVDAGFAITTEDGIAIIVTHDSNGWYVSFDECDQGMQFDSEAGAIDFAWYLSSNN
jgi:hypothetical protein